MSAYMLKMADERFHHSAGYVGYEGSAAAHED